MVDSAYAETVSFLFVELLDFFVLLLPTVLGGAVSDSFDEGVIFSQPKIKENADFKSTPISPPRLMEKASLTSNLNSSER